MDQQDYFAQQELMAQYKKQQQKTTIKIVAIVLGAVLALATIAGVTIAVLALSSNSSDTYTSSTYDDTTYDDTSWVPAGYNVWSDDSNIAWRWGDDSETDCSYSSSSCWSVMVVTHFGCSSDLYGEINIFDSNDIQISYANDSLASVAPLQQVKLTFDTFDDNAANGRVAQLNCY